MQIRHIAQSTPDKPAVILHPAGTAVTFGELELRANQLAHLFRVGGLVEGDAVVIAMENNEHMHAVMWAARRCGLYYVPLSTHLTAAEAAYIIDNSDAKGIVASAKQLRVLADLAEKLPRGLPPVRVVTGGEFDGWHRFPDYVENFPVSPIDDEVEGDLLQYSSGTTGRPKGIKRELTHLRPQDVPGMLEPLVSAWMDADSVYLTPAPLYHTAPSMWSMQALAGGVTVVVMEKFDPEGVLEAIAKHSVTHGQFVPVMFTRMLKLPDQVRNSYDVSSLKRVIHAAAPCPVEIKKQMIDWWGTIIDEYYSSSEAHGATLITSDEWLLHPGSVGRPMAGAIVHIVDEDGHELPPGQVGEVYFEGGQDFEYLNDAEKTASSRHPHGWKTVGDLGYVDEEGYLYLTDRRHHMIISGGVNIYPQEAENILVTHPKVMDAAVFGIPDTEMGQSVKAAVQTVDPADATPEFAGELLNWLRDRLSHYKCPRSISFEADLPRTDAGKLYKQELIKKYS